MPSEPKVLFINKGLKSRTLTRSVGVEKSRIFSHVQRPSQTRLPCSSLPPCRAGAEPGCFNTASHSSTTECPRRSSATSQSSNANGGTLEKRRQSKANGIVRRPSPLIAVSIAQLDLFGSPAAPITNYMTAVLEFYSGPMLQRIFPSKLLADASRQHTLSYASGDAVVLNAILCTTSGALYMHYGDMKHAYHAMYFKDQAIRCLKEEISKKENYCIGISTVYAVSLLLWVECLQGDMDAVEAHIKGLDQLVASAAGFYDSPLPIMSTILSSSYYSSAMLGSQPVLEPPIESYEDTISLPTLEALNLWDTLEFSKLGSRFFSTANSATIGPRLLQLVSRQRQFMLFKQLSALERINPTYNDIQCVYNTELATEYHLLNMPYSLDEDPITSVQDAIRLALYIHSQPIITVASPTAAFSRYMAKQLKEALERTKMSELWEPSSDLLLWVLFVGARISYGQLEYSWLVAHIAMIVSLLGISSSEELREILVEFYYFPRTFDRTLEVVWKDVELILTNGEQ